MNINDHFHKKALELRREGNSFADIAKHLRVSRTAVHNWVKNIRLTEAEKQLLKKNIVAKKGRARLQATITLRTRKVYKEKVAYEKAEKEFEKLSKDPMFMLGMGLWGIEKAKKNKTSLTFTTASTETMGFMKKWIQEYLQIPQKSLKIRVLKIKSGESTSFTVSKMEPIRRLIAWQKLTMLYYS